MMGYEILCNMLNEYRELTRDFLGGVLIFC